MRRGIVVGRVVGTLLLVVAFADLTSARALESHRGQLFIDAYQCPSAEAAVPTDCRYAEGVAILIDEGGVVTGPVGTTVAGEFRRRHGGSHGDRLRGRWHRSGRPGCRR